MARKYDEIKWLAQATAQDLSADAEKWKGFLIVAAKSTVPQRETQRQVHNEPVKPHIEL